METTLQDLRYAFRSLLKAPGFAAVAILTIALGIGANTAIFTIVNALLMRPLPYASPERLVMVWQDLRARGGPADEWATPGNFVDWKAERGVFENLAAISGWRPTLTGAGEPEALPGEQVSHEYFAVLGINPALGRDFAPEDDVPNARRVAILSHELWMRRFGGDRSAVGRVVTLSGEPHEIVGVLPPRFRPIVNSTGEIWRPLRLNRANPSRGAIFLRVVARIPPGLSLDRAQAGATQLAKRLEAVYPQHNEKTNFDLQPLHDSVTGQIKPGLLALLAGVAFVLLIACANIANLLMARGSGRGRELAVRAAIGAGRARIVRQLLTESVLLAAAGGVAGLLVGVWSVDALVALAPANAPRLNEIRLDAAVFAFATLITLVTGLLFGLAPAAQHSRVDITHALKDGGRGSAGTGGRTLRRSLIAVEVALALVLLTGGVLLIQTFVKLQAADLGFRTEGVLIGSVAPPRVTYQKPERYIALYDQLLEKLSAIPGVQQAAITSIPPLSAGDNDTGITIEGRPAPTLQSETPVTWYRSVSAGYFDLIGMRLVRGHGFTPHDPAPAVVVNETMVKKYFAAEDPLGRRIKIGGAKDEWFTIVGVVADAKVQGARLPARVETFVPYWHLTEGGTVVVLRGNNPESFAAPLRQAVASLDRDIPVANIRTMSQMLSESIGQPRFFATLAGGFAAIALLLAAIGIYGVMAYGVSQRTAEIGVRVALGATAPEIFRLIVGDGLKLAAIGVAFGIGGAIAVGRWLGTLLFDVTPTDPVTLAATAGILVAVAGIASFVPAFRAARVDPIVALRAE
jgi:putative ABC transport system permease protein